MVFLSWSDWPMMIARDHSKWEGGKLLFIPRKRSCIPVCFQVLIHSHAWWFPPIEFFICHSFGTILLFSWNSFPSLNASTANWKLFGFIVRRFALEASSHATHGSLLTDCVKAWWSVWRSEFHRNVRQVERGRNVLFVERVMSCGWGRNIVILRGGHLGKNYTPSKFLLLSSVSWWPDLSLAMALVDEPSIPRAWRSVSWGLSNRVRCI